MNFDKTDGTVQRKAAGGKGLRRQLFLYVCCEKCYIIIVVLRGGLLPLPDEMQQPAQEERQHVAECGDDSHGNGVEHNGVGVQKCAACEHHDCFADTDAARSTGGDEANDPREQVGS